MTKPHLTSGAESFSMRPADILLLIGSGAALVLLLAVGDTPAPVRLDPPLVAHVTGLLAGYGIAVMLVLMSRSPALERGVGADRLARWHSRGGPAVLALTAAHAVAAAQAWVYASGRSVVVAGLDLLQLPGLLTATIATMLLFAVGIASARTARRRLSYERWHALHLLTYLSAGLAFSHQLAGPDLAGRPVIQVAWGLLYAYAFALVVRFRFIAPLHQALRHRLRVRQVIPEANGVVSVVIGGAIYKKWRRRRDSFFAGAS